MKSLEEQLADAKAELDRIERAIRAAPCAEVGHRWKHLGGKHAGCVESDPDFDCDCSLPVYECEVCGNCDYGENEEAREIIANCKARREKRSSK